jgi:hypothetical protein
MELAGFIMYYRPGVHKSRVTKSCAVAVKVCGSAVYIIVRWLLGSSLTLTAFDGLVFFVI